MDADIPHELNRHVCAAGRVRIAGGLAAGSAYGDLFGDGTCGCSD